MERRLSGRTMPMIHGKDDMLETLKKIEQINIPNEEKDMLFIVAQKSKTNEKEQLIKELEIIIETGYIFPKTSTYKIIREKLDRINNMEKQEIINIATSLKTRIENNEILV